jgi:hypothetical protein
MNSTASTTRTTATVSGLIRTFVYYVGAETAQGWPLYARRVDSWVPVLMGNFPTEADAVAALPA